MVAKTFRRYFSFLLALALVLGVGYTPMAYAEENDIELSEDVSISEDEKVQKQNSVSEDETKEEVEEVAETSEENTEEENTEETLQEEEKEEPFVLDILHVNDIHGKLDYSENSIGYAKLKTYYDSLPGNKLLFDLGDHSQGEVEVNLKKGRPTFEIMNLVGFDATVLGNHEFDFGYQDLIDNTNIANYPVLSSNISGTHTFDQGFIKEIDGVKVGIFGIATPETKYKASPLNTKGLEFNSPVEVAKSEVKRLKDEGAEIVIALVHLGIDGSTAEEQRSTALLDIDGLDLVLDGHSHSIFSKQVGDTFTAQVGTKFALLGKVTLTYDKETGEKTFSSTQLSPSDFADVQENKQVKEYIDNLVKEVEPLKEEVIGRTDVLLEGTREEVRSRQTNLGQIIVTAIKEATNADVVLTNGGGIRASIEVGDITKGDVLTVLPFGNTVTVIEATGQDILDALTFGTIAYPDVAGSYPHVAGVTFDLLKVRDEAVKDDEGNIIKGIYEPTNVLVDGKPIDLSKVYTFATNDFLAIGGDGYTMFEGAKQISLLPGMAEVVMEYIQNQGVITLEDNIEFPKLLEELPTQDEDETIEEDKTEETDKVEEEITDNIDEEITKPNNENKEIKDNKTHINVNKVKNPNTGDDFPVVGLAGLAILATVILIVANKQKNKTE